VKSNRRALVGREQQATPFNTMLVALCDATAALGAALVDRDGETVDFAGSLDVFDIKVAAAEWRLVLDLVRGSAMWSWSECQEIVVRGTRASFVVIPLGDGYAVVAQLSRHAFGVSSRAVAEAARELSREAGLAPSAHGDGVRWSRVEVQPSAADTRRPQAIWRHGQWSPVVVLGRYRESDLPSGELGYRVRTAPGNEVTLVREALGIWYADDSPDA
jgi:hypothetical protein